MEFIGLQEYTSVILTFAETFFFFVYYATNFRLYIENAKSDWFHIMNIVVIKYFGKNSWDCLHALVPYTQY